MLIRTGGENWLIHRMDPPARQDWEPMPTLVRPMLATLGELPPASEDAGYGYEMKWDGLRAVVYVDGGSVRVLTRNDLEVTATYPELRALGEALGSTHVVLDGEAVAFDRSTGRVSFAALQPRMHVQNRAQARRLSEQVPVTFVVAVHVSRTLPCRREQRGRRQASCQLPAAWSRPWLGECNRSDQGMIAVGALRRHLQYASAALVVGAAAGPAAVDGSAGAGDDVLMRTNAEQVRADPQRPVEVFDRDVSMLIGVLAVLEAEARMEPDSRVIRRFARDAERYGLLDADAGVEQVANVLNSMNQRLRRARGEHDGVS